MSTISIQLDPENFPSRGYSSGKVYESAEYEIHFGSGNTPTEQRQMAHLRFKTADLTFYGGAEFRDAMKIEREHRDQSVANGLAYIARKLDGQQLAQLIHQVRHEAYQLGVNTGRAAQQLSLREALGIRD